MIDCPVAKERIVQTDFINRINFFHNTEYGKSSLASFPLLSHLQSLSVYSKNDITGNSLRNQVRFIGQYTCYTVNIKEKFLLCGFYFSLIKVNFTVDKVYFSLYTILIVLLTKCIIYHIVHIVKRIFRNFGDRILMPVSHGGIKKEKR